MKWLFPWVFGLVLALYMCAGSSTLHAEEVDGNGGDEPAAVEETQPPAAPEHTPAKPAAPDAPATAPDVQPAAPDVQPAASDAPATAPDAPATAPDAPAPDGDNVSVYVVPIEGPIDTPQLFILRRALKQAIDNDVDAVVLKMDTPGGALNVTLEMMQALERFPGTSITFVDREAISAGSFIAVATDDIYFAPSGMMGAAAVISGTGEDINETLKQKIDSYLRARVRVLSEKYRYRADVQRAMMDADFELTLDGTEIVGEGELLTLTANEAVAKYGDPPEALLARGIAEDLDALLNDRFGAGNWQMTEFKLTWSEAFAKWLRALVPMLMGIALLLLFIEFKTPGFGFFGILGIALFVVVFASNHVAGLAGYEPLILFACGLILLLVELFLLPGIMIAGLLGVVCVIGALVWSMADIWPEKVAPLTVDVFLAPVGDMLIGIAIAVVLAVLFGTVLPRSWFLEKLVLGGNVGSGANPSNPNNSPSAVRTSGASACPAVGSRGVAVTDLFPSGKVEVDGVRFHARTEMGFLSRGEDVEVIAVRDSTMIVRKP